MSAPTDMVIAVADVVPDRDEKDFILDKACAEKEEIANGEQNVYK
jgi:hypothetical protein